MEDNYGIFMNLLLLIFVVIFFVIGLCGDLLIKEIMNVVGFMVVNDLLSVVV